MTAAWDIWWYGGSFGQRALIQAYPVLLFPIAALLTTFENQKRSLTNPVVKEKGEAKATIGSVDFSFSLTHVHGICQRTNN